MNQPWIRLSKEGEEAVRMFCFPYSGGSAQAFLPFAEKLPLHVAVYAYEMPGRGRRFQDSLAESLNFLVNEAVDGLLSFQDNCRFVFFGHSLGGIISFETARELRRRKMPLPMHLYVSAKRAPHIPLTEPPVSKLPHDEFVEKLKVLGGTPDEILANQEILELMVPILQNDFKMFETYVYQQEPPLECPITAFGGLQDKFVTPDDIQKWSEHTERLFTRHVFNGRHFFIQSHFDEVIDIILKTLTMQMQGPW